MAFLKRYIRTLLMIELTAMGFNVAKEKRIMVYYFGNIVGDYNADLIVEEMVTVELKANEVLVL